MVGCNFNLHFFGRFDDAAGSIFDKIRSKIRLSDDNEESREG